MIIDAHTHIFERGVGGPRTLPASADDLVRYMDEAGVDVSVVLPLPGVASNEFVFSECARHPGRLKPLYNPDFTDPARTLSKAVSFLQDHHAHGLKIHPRAQRFMINHPVMSDVLCWGEETGLTVLFDGLLYGEYVANPLVYPLAFHDICAAHPKLRIVLAHCGGHRPLDAYMVAKAHLNLFMDVSLSIVWFDGSSVPPDIRFIADRLWAGRILYGSDFPDFAIADYLTATRRLMEGLDPERTAGLYAEAARTLYDI